MTDQPSTTKASPKYRPDGSRVPKKAKPAASLARAAADRADTKGATPLTEAREAGLSRSQWERAAQEGLW